MTDIKERLRLVAQDPRKAPELQALLNDAAAEIERLERVPRKLARDLRIAGATVPLENKGTIESAMNSGLSIALMLVEQAVAQQGGKE